VYIYVPVAHIKQLAAFVHSTQLDKQFTQVKVTESANVAAGQLEMQIP
jgi:hypothetical protein